MANWKQLLGSIGIVYELEMATPASWYRGHYLRIGPMTAGYHATAVHQYKAMSRAEQYNPPRLTEGTLHSVQRELRDAIRSMSTSEDEDESSDGTSDGTYGTSDKLLLLPA